MNGLKITAVSLLTHLYPMKRAVTTRVGRASHSQWPSTQLHPYEHLVFPSLPFCCFRDLQTHPESDGSSHNATIQK